MTSSVVNVTVDNFPSVTLTSPTNNARFIAGANINLAATAADGSDAIASVQFFQGTNLLGGVTSAPYSFTWSNAPAGAYALTAQATDLGGLMTTSAVVNIMVAGITLTNPPNNDVFAAPASATLGVAVTDNASITQVQFFQGTNSLGIVTSPPYTVNWTGATPGVYTLTATGRDATGFVFTSAPVTVIVDTNPTTTNRSGDGQSDYLDYLEGRNPLVGTVPDTQNLINFQVYTPLQ
jgi:chitinase